MAMIKSQFYSKSLKFGPLFSNSDNLHTQMHLRDIDCNYQTTQEVKYMRDVYTEYRKGLLSWEEAYFIANNIAATSAGSIETSSEETEYWCRQMESLGVDAAEHLMRTQYGYKQNTEGVFYK